MLLVEESNVQPVESPVTIVGDLHGQFFDLLHMFEKVSGSPPSTSYVFLGDFVDRGHYSVETLTLLLVLKAKYPGHITLLRGNHESRQITQVYGFYDECCRKYGNAAVWRYCVATFDYFSLAAIIDSRVLCVHGGLSPEIRTIDQIRTIERQQEIPHEGAFCDLMWSDPEDIVSPWQVSPRGAGYLFGSRVTDEFNEINDLHLIARAHQLVMEGKRFHFAKNNLVTVWSAPNYCYRCGNVASVLQIKRPVTESLDHYKDPHGNGPPPLTYGSSNFGGSSNSIHAIEISDDEEEKMGDSLQSSNEEDDGGPIAFKYFSETATSVHGPKGEERAQLVPYFL